MQQNQRNPAATGAPQQREFEAQLLLEAALRLQAVQTHWDNSKGDVDEALLYNRQLWSAFLASIANRKQPLPVEIRRTIAGLAAFVANQTNAIMENPRPERLTALIGINRDLAAGLLGKH